MTGMRTSRWRRMGAAVVAAGLVLSACGGDDAAPAPITTATLSSSSISSSTTTSTTVSQTPTPTPSTTEEPPPPPPPPAIDALTGGPQSSNLVIAAKIDNTNFGGSQYGTAAADVVYVQMVEGGLTRLLAVFHTSIPDEVGPIRSIRSTDPDVLKAYGSPALAFSGGGGGLADLNSSTVINASQDSGTGGYWRSDVASGTHNLHVNLAQIVESVPGIGVPNNPGFSFGADYPALAGGRDVGSVVARMMASVTFQFNGSYYEYVRQGDISVDGASGAPVAIDNLVVQRVYAEPDGIVDAAGNPSYKSYSTGDGEFTLYRDGKAIDGTWSRPDVNGPTSYLDAAGQPVLFKPGKTWVLLVPQGGSVAEN